MLKFRWNITVSQLKTALLTQHLYILCTGSHAMMSRYVHFCAHLTSLDRTLLLTSVCPSICLSNVCDKTKAPSEKSSIMSFPMSQRWTAYVAPKPPIWLLWKLWFARWRHFTYLWSNAHHNYVPDFTPAFRLSLCHTRDSRLNGLISKCLLHVRCALAVHGSGPTCHFYVSLLT